jgi:membrane-bound ClpP family serine protease
VAYAITFAAILTGIGVMIAHASRRKKSNVSCQSLVHSAAVVEHQLAPTGTVLVRGELWRARSLRGRAVPAKTPVIVVGLSNHLLLVDE